jgi:hypothetical protein
VLKSTSRISVGFKLLAAEARAWGWYNCGYQFEQTMEGLKAGPLPDEAVERIDHVWKTIEHEAPLDNYNDNLLLFKK